MLYLSDDGVTFRTEEACLMHEKRLREEAEEREREEKKEKVHKQAVKEYHMFNELLDFLETTGIITLNVDEITYSQKEDIIIDIIETLIS